jgi:DNA-binding response OmpR family regulator
VFITKEFDLATILNNINILLMEDDIDLGETLEDILKKAGYEVFLLKNGLDASTITYEQNFDLYIFDFSSRQKKKEKK